MFAFWSVFILYILAYLCSLYAKSGGGFDNAAPRPYLNSLKEGARQRAYWAQLNIFEIAPLYIAALFAAFFMEADKGAINFLAALFLLFRLIYILAYIGNKATLRSIAWAVNIGCIFALFLLPV